MRYFFTDGRKATNNKQLTLQCIMAYVIWYHLCYLCSVSLHTVYGITFPNFAVYHSIRYMVSPFLSWHTVYGITYPIMAYGIWYHLSYHGIRYMVLTLQCIMAYGIWYQLCSVSWYTVYGITFPNFAVYHGIQYMVSPFLVYHGIRYMVSRFLTLQCIMAYAIWYHLS